jgi:hypothetical protein
MGYRFVSTMEPEHLVGHCLGDADQDVGTDEYSTRDRGRRIRDDVPCALMLGESTKRSEDAKAGLGP